MSLPPLNPNSVTATLPTFTLSPQGDDAMEFSVNVRILGDEKRFGFSVMGGVDEGFPPRIDEISKGRLQLFNQLV